MLVRFESRNTLSPLLDELFDTPFDSPVAEGSAFAPPVDVADGKDELVVVAELPGVKKEDVKISLEKGVLALSGERKREPVSGKFREISRGRPEGKFARTIRLPHEVDAARVTAELSDGLLKIVLPRAEAARAHEITVR